MAVTVVKRPTGHKIIDQAIAANIIEDYVGDATVFFLYHGLGTGDTVYITSDIDDYNGFWYVTAIDVNQFKISEHSTADFVEFYQEIDIDYYQTQEHDWNSIFLPIVYKLSNDRWPVNSIDAERTVSSQSDDNGFTNLNLSGILKSQLNALEFVKISGASDEDLNGVWQIVEVITTSDISINLPYSASNSFAGATVQNYHNNYQVKVKIFAGLNPSHPWASKKPYEEVAELSLTPDDNNEVMFSVSDYITMKVSIKNNLTLFSLPLNLDAFTQFFISTAESYDDSDSYSLTTFESGFTDDTFEGYAIAGKLPFKNLYSGDYADYVYTPGSPAMWLTLMNRLLGVDGLFFDVSFIKNIPGDLVVMITKYISDYGILEEVQYTDQGIGVYRIPITLNASYDSFCIQVRTLDTPGTPGSGGVETPVGDFPSISAFTNLGTGDSWITGATPSVNVVSGTSKLLRSPSYAFTIGTEYKITVNYTKVYNSGSGITHEIALRAEDSSLGIYFSELQDTTSGSHVDVLVLQFVASNALMNRISIEVDDDSNIDVTIDSFVITTVSAIIPGIPATAGALVTEEICIDILEACEVQNGFIPDARLLEDGDYRLLE